MIKTFEKILGDENEPILFTYPAKVYDPITTCWQILDSGENDVDQFLTDVCTMKDVLETTDKAVEALGDGDESVVVVRTDFGYEGPAKMLVVSGDAVATNVSPVHWFD